VKPGPAGSGARSSGPRATGAAAVAAVVLAVPVILGLTGRYRVDGAAGNAAVVVLVLTVILPPMVFELFSRDAPEWWHGLVFDAVGAAVASTALMVALAGSGGEDGSLPVGDYIGYGVLLFFGCFVVGMAGPSVASLVGRALPPASERRAATRVRPWHVGAGVAVAYLVAAIVVALVR
jgi:hypothetical protein